MKIVTVSTAIICLMFAFECFPSRILCWKETLATNSKKVENRLKIESKSFQPQLEESNDSNFQMPVKIVRIAVKGSSLCTKEKIY